MLVKLTTLLTIIKVFIKYKILSAETFLSAYMHINTHTHTHTHTQAPVHMSIHTIQNSIYTQHGQQIRDLRLMKTTAMNGKHGRSI